MTAVFWLVGAPRVMMIVDDVQGDQIVASTSQKANKAAPRDGSALLLGWMGMQRRRNFAASITCRIAAVQLQSWPVTIIPENSRKVGSGPQHAKHPRFDNPPPHSGPPARRTSPLHPGSFKAWHAAPDHTLIPVARALPAMNRIPRPT